MITNDETNNKKKVGLNEKHLQHDTGNAYGQTWPNPGQIRMDIWIGLELDWVNLMVQFSLNGREKGPLVAKRWSHVLWKAHEFTRSLRSHEKLLASISYKRRQYGDSDVCTSE